MPLKNILNSSSLKGLSGIELIRNIPNQRARIFEHLQVVARIPYHRYRPPKFRNIKRSPQAHQHSPQRISPQSLRVVDLDHLDLEQSRTYRP